MCPRLKQSKHVSSKHLIIFDNFDSTSYSVMVKVLANGAYFARSSDNQGQLLIKSSNIVAAFQGMHVSPAKQLCVTTKKV